VIGYNLSFPISITTHDADVDVDKGWWFGLVPLNTYSVGRYSIELEVETTDKGGYKVLLPILVGLIDGSDGLTAFETLLL
jgi:hypothetical protein